MRLPVFRRLLVRQRSGRWGLRLGDDERKLLASLADQLCDLIESEPDEPVLSRLFPTAYPDDIAHEAEWQVFKAAELRDSMRDHLGVLEAITTQTEMSNDEVHSWMRALNALRLVIGTRLDVSEENTEDQIDPDDPDYSSWVLYDFLGHLLDRTVRDLSG